MFHHVFSPPCLCFTVSLVHHVYVLPCLCSIMSMFHHSSSSSHHCVCSWSTTGLGLGFGQKLVSSLGCGLKSGLGLGWRVWTKDMVEHIHSGLKRWWSINMDPQQSNRFDARLRWLVYSAIPPQIKCDCWNYFVCCSVDMSATQCLCFLWTDKG